MNQKYKQAIPFIDQTRGYETEVVGRCFMTAHTMGWRPITAWLQWETNVEVGRTTVSVAVDMKFGKLCKQVAQITGMVESTFARNIYDADGETLLTKCHHWRNDAGYAIMVHKDMATKQVTVMFSNMYQ